MRSRRPTSLERTLKRRADRLARDLGELHDPTGVNVERAENFMRALGVPLPRYAIIDEVAAPEAAKALRRTGLRKNRIPKYGEVHGRYFPLFDQVLVYRSMQNAYPTERTLVHELGHGAIRIPLPSGLTILLNELRGRPFPPVTHGFTNGSFNSEGVIEMFAGSYAQLLQGGDGYHDDSVLPEKYQADHPYTFGAVALEALCTRTPELFDLLLGVNRNPDAVTGVKAVYDDIQPGLFEYLEQDINLPDTNQFGDAYEAGLNRVLDATGYTYDDIPVIHTQGVVISRIQPLLDTYTMQTGYVFEPDTP